MISFSEWSYEQCSVKGHRIIACKNSDGVNVGFVNSSTNEYFELERVNVNRVDCKIEGLGDVSDTSRGRLWLMLDDIDTLSDAIKPVDIDGFKEFHRHVIDLSRKRHLILSSDGYNLFDI